VAKRAGPNEPARSPC